jgi:hypothetical protein
MLRNLKQFFDRHILAGNGALGVRRQPPHRTGRL